MTQLRKVEGIGISLPDPTKYASYMGTGTIITQRVHKRCATVLSVAYKHYARSASNTLCTCTTHWTCSAVCNAAIVENFNMEHFERRGADGLTPVLSIIIGWHHRMLLKSSADVCGSRNVEAIGEIKEYTSWNLKLGMAVLWCVLNKQTSVLSIEDSLLIVRLSATRNALPNYQTRLILLDF